MNLLLQYSRLYEDPRASRATPSCFFNIVDFMKNPRATPNRSQVLKLKAHTIMSNSSINATYTSVYIDKDEDFLTNQNETFEYTEHHPPPPSFTTSNISIKRFTTSNISIKRAMSPRTMGRKVVCRRKFYRWSSIDVHLLSSSKKLAPAQRLGLRVVRRKKEEENTSPSTIAFKVEHDDLPSFLSFCISPGKMCSHPTTSRAIYFADFPLD